MYFSNTCVELGNVPGSISLECIPRGIFFSKHSHWLLLVTIDETAHPCLQGSGNMERPSRNGQLQRHSRQAFRSAKSDWMDEDQLPQGNKRWPLAGSID